MRFVHLAYPLVVISVRFFMPIVKFIKTRLPVKETRCWETSFAPKKRKRTGSYRSSNAGVTLRALQSVPTFDLWARAMRGRLEPTGWGRVPRRAGHPLDRNQFFHEALTNRVTATGDSDGI